MNTAPLELGEISKFLLFENSIQKGAIERLGHDDLPLANIRPTYVSNVAVTFHI